MAATPPLDPAKRPRLMNPVDAAAASTTIPKAAVVQAAPQPQQQQQSSNASSWMNQPMAKRLASPGFPQATAQAKTGGMIPQASQQYGQMQGGMRPGLRPTAPQATPPRAMTTAR